MARSLADIVGQNKKGLVKGPKGVLSEEEQPDLQGLTGQAGLPAAPTTAVGGAMIGATPQQQKMMGSPAQLQNALRMSAEGAETLEGARQLKQARTATTAEQEKMARAEELSGLSSAEKTAKALIDKEKQKLAPAAGADATAPTPAPEAMVVKQAPTGLNLTADAFNAVRPLIVNALTDIQAGKPIPPETMAQINNALGKPIDSLVDENTLKQFLVESKDLIKQQGADAVANNLFVSDLLDEPEFGYTAPQLAELLGVDEEPLKKTAIGDLDLLIKNAQAQAFSTVTGARQALQSGLVGQAEAEALRGTIREASETGIAATEEDFQKLDDAVERADIITFGGKQMTIGDALKDETISQFISDYISATPEKKKEMEAQEPALTTFVKNNQAVFDAANEGFKAGSAEFKKTQDTTLAYAKNFPEQLLNTLVPDWKKPSGTSLQDRTKDIPFFQYFESFAKNPKAQKQISDNLTRIVNAYPDIVKDLKGLTAEDLKKLSLDKSSTTKLDEYVAGRKRYDEIQNLDPDNIDAIVQQLAGGDTSVNAKAIQKALTQNASLTLLGLEPSDLSVFDSDGDGRLDNPATLLDSLKKNTSVSSLGRFLRTSKGWKLPDFDTDAAEAVGVSATLLDKLSRELRDGKLTAKEIERNNNFTIDELADIMTSKEFGNFSVALRTGLNRLVGRLKSESFDADMRNALGKDLAKVYDNPVMQAQVADTEIYRRDLGQLGMGSALANLQSKKDIRDKLNQAIQEAQQSSFPKVDIERMIAYRDAVERMIEITGQRIMQIQWEEEQARLAEEDARRDRERRALEELNKRPPEAVESPY